MTFYINKGNVFTEYDVSGYLGHSEKLSSPEDVIAAGRGVCCGYASLFTEMCRYTLLMPQTLLNSYSTY